ncbi:glycoside hydrolase family 108 protein [Chelatococcus sp. GCM10030263]|uniref:glycoside hydrolase family 108 protein n=1 Tax=Chelatococcus sp. GCM10030263 TaxID=3273387 RepID=UPI003605CD39
MVAINFSRCVDLILANEGGYVDDPQDLGGATNLGITRATLSAYRGRAVTKDEVRALRIGEAKTIYRRNYWNAVSADDLPAGLDLAVFDCAVNSGAKRAALLLQQALGVKQDGIIGPITLEAAAAARRVVETIARYDELRLAFLARLPTFPRFGKGWRKRVETVEREALTLAASGPASAGSPSPMPQRSGTFMIDLKKILLNRPIWANLVGLASIGLSLFGIDTSGLDTAGLSDSILQVVAGASFIVSSVLHLRQRTS